MRGPSFLIIALFFMSLFSLNDAQGDEVASTLHEGTHVGTGVRVDATKTVEHRVLMDSDLALIPIPGGGKLNGTHLELVLNTGLIDGSPQVTRASAHVVRWPSLRLLGIEKDQDKGVDWGLEFLGASIPIALAGDLNGSDYVILQSGASVGYQTLSSQTQGHTFTATCRADEQISVSDRVLVRLSQDVNYVLTYWKSDGAPLDSEQRLSASAGAILSLDLTDRPTGRWTLRTDPATGEKKRLWRTDEGKRIRWNLIDLKGTLNLLDETGVARSGLVITTGIGGEF
jgi:hypothetical protein